MISFKHLVKTTFTDLSTPKRWLLRGSFLAIAVGVGAKAFGWFGDSDIGEADWSWSSIQSGIGYVAGFLIGAIVRVFLKLSLIVTGLIVLVGFGLSQLGIDGGGMISEFGSALGERAKEQATNFQEFIGGFLPASIMSGLGVASGVTQRPDMTPDND